MMKTQRPGNRFLRGAEALWQLPNSYYWPVLTWLLFLCQFTYATIPAEDWFELSPELAQIGGFMFWRVQQGDWPQQGPARAPCHVPVADVL